MGKPIDTVEEVAQDEEVEKRRQEAADGLCIYILRIVHFLGSDTLLLREVLNGLNSNF